MIHKSISIIIRTLNEERYLSQLLESIYSQNINLSFEVVVIDSGSTDRTLSILVEYPVRLLTIDRSEFTFGRSLNRACASCSSDYLVFISGHCVPLSSTWLSSLLQPLLNGVASYTYGRQLGGPKTYHSELNIFKKYYPAFINEQSSTYFCNNANSALPFSIWSEYGFNEELTGLEDLHLAKQLQKDGHTISYVPASAVYHHHSESWSQIQRRFEREALALQHIAPEITLSAARAFRFSLYAIIRDLLTIPPDKPFLPTLLSVLLYRYHQYRGSYRGSRAHTLSALRQRDSYFYPDSTKGHPLRS